MNDKILTIKKSTLVDIANEVRAKTGSTDLIKVADLDDAVKELSGGGGVVEVDELPNPTLVTPVPNSGYVEKVYFDTSLSVDAVVAELEKLTFTQYNDCALIWNDYWYIMVYKENNQYKIMDDGDDGTLYFSTLDYNNMNGWNPEFNGEININAEIEGSSECEKVSNLLYINKEPNPEFNPEAIYKLPDETLWMYKDGKWCELSIGGADYPVAEYSVNIYNSFVNSIYYSLDLGKTWLTLDAESEVDVTTMYGITSGIGAAAFDQPIPTISAGIVLIGLAGSKDDDNFITMTSELQITVESDFGSAYYNRGTGVYSISNISDQSISEAEFVYAIPVLSDAGITVGCRPS